MDIRDNASQQINRLLDNFLLKEDPKAYRELLESRLEELKVLCDEINPYIPLSQEHKEKLSALNIVSLDDPFALTNQLLVLTEDTLEELEKIKQQDK
ncbi:hypothetical protein HBN50_11430 [Halobacteriovorax sp. GB3]|uniref:hypothetical protein n=1 Tax=Halobacteriovorax sp. GB3 TaxID=2719615 RepID=UPI002360DBDA|nr:hypothetical protein [Halobacteriovorax sp. GB3]MDD0853712.1 hypothetical protein [Halobacteriovorax sp. GB3]